MQKKVEAWGEGVWKMFGVLMTFFNVAPSFNLEISTISSISRNIGGVIAPPVP